MPLSRLSSPFLSGTSRVTLHMLQLLLALVPAIIAMVYFFGVAVLINISLAIITALLAEALILKLRHRPIKPFLLDGSVIVTAVLLAIALPPLAPWWLTVIGIIFAIIFAKHLYGGLGYNPFNPAMVAYVVLLISFPLEMTTWLQPYSIAESSPNFNTAFQLIFSGSQLGIDALSGATPLDDVKTAITLLQPPSVTADLYLGKAWQWINIWFAVGGLFLLYKKVIRWHVPVAVLSSLLVISLITWLIAPEITGSPLFHLVSGGTMLAAFFIATDPVTASTTIKGRLIFGAGVGALIYIIRIWGGYPDGVAFAILLMNMMVPLIDYYTQPKVYGAKEK